MQLRLISEKHALLVSLEGELDHHTANSVREKIDTEIKRSNAKNIIFDFRKLNFMDSSGIGVIIGRYKVSKILGGETIIFSPTNAVRRIIEMSGIHKIIKLATITNSIRIFNIDLFNIILFIVYYILLYPI